MIKLDGVKSIFKQKNTKKLITYIGVFLVGLLLIIGLRNSFAVLTPVSSVIVPSTTLDYSKKEEGSWQYTKTAKWVSKGKARINIKLETMEKSSSEYTDVILVLDTSGSMVKDKLIQLQNDVNELINYTIPKGNKVALITFSGEASIVTDFTDDITLLQNSINNLVTSGETNYYQALVKVDDVLKNYNKETNRDCVVLFLTDGLPTIETPNEVGQYNYLKKEYEYLSINGIQYELGKEVLSGIKNITDFQYIADKDSLNEFLYKASTSAASYDKFILTDYVDDNYFNLDDVTNISTTFGETSTLGNKVIWDLSGLKSGTIPELTIDINLNDNLIGVGGVYSTHKKADVAYEITSTSATESSTKTPVLSDNYIVSYDANAPIGCVVSNMPSKKNYSVFDNVKIEDTVPTCAGYQFKEWKIVTDGVKKVGDDQFIMPESNVTIKAVWKKLGLVKSMDGTISKVQSLYKLMADSSKGVDTSVDFSEGPNDTSSGIYTRKGTEADKYPVHYYRGIIDNNNVLFAGFCWKMVRTTSTGGVKLIYNGTAVESYDSTTPITQDKYINVSNDATYPYIYDTTTNKWSSTNKTDSKTGTISFSVLETGTYILSYSVSSETRYDKAYFYKDDVELKVDSGTNSNTISLGELTSSNVIMVKYTKDSSGADGSDSVTFSVDKASGNVVKNCNNANSRIGTASFNSSFDSLADAGYMYGTRYTYNQYAVDTSISVLNRSSISSSSNYYYGDSVTYSNGTYTLTNAVQKTWSDNYSNLVGYYTCRSTSNTCSTAYYIAGSTSSYQYTLSLSNGATDPSAQTITLGKGMTDNGDGTYSLTDPVIVEKKDWFTTYSTYKDYYLCSDLTSTTCENKNLIISTGNYRLSYDRTFNYIYGNDISWDGSKYILTDTFTSTNFWITDRTTLAEKYHYTCLNAIGECTNVYYISHFGASSYIYYLTLSSGKNIEAAKDEMFTNTNSSEIKQVIDTWYEKNMTSYTEKLEDTIWCNDRTLYSGSLVGKDADAGIQNFYFMAYNRVNVTYSPSLECPNALRDGFTVSTDSGGNGDLTYPIGLLTADEIRLAGGYDNTYYLYSGQDYWTLSPFGSFSKNVLGFIIYSSGTLNNGGISQFSGVRPAISLKKGTKAIDGDGTVENPYVVE